jgi:anaerobic selenocysteine-containing dehydrogenase
MKLGRRTFLQFIAGAVGGSLLTPVPWQLADDTAIWSQNWSWRPSPKPGSTTRGSGICLFCDGGCGIRVDLIDRQRAVLLQGNPDHPVNAGGVCPLGAAGLQFLYAPSRIQQPMKQTRQRGDAGGFKPIAWNEALEELAERLAILRSQGKPHGVAAVTGQPPSSMIDLWRHFCAAYGSPNLFQMPSAADSRRLAVKLALGFEADVAFALERASYVLSFGANLAEGWGAPGRLQRVFGRWRQDIPGAIDTKIVHIEPRCSLTAAKADEWIAIKPGTEAALALGIAHVLIRDKLYDADFVQTHACGFDGWVDGEGKRHQGFQDLVLSGYAPDRVAALTGVDEPRIRNLAREFATQKNAVAVWSNGKETCPSPIHHDLVFIALNALVGGLHHEGLLSVVPPVPLAPLPTLNLDQVARKGAAQPRLDLTRETGTLLPGNALHGFLEAAAASPAYSVDVLLIHEANPAYALPNNRVFRAALDKVGTVVSFSSYMDETALLCDLILPNHCAPERYDDRIGLRGAPYGYYAVAAPLIRPTLDTKHTGDALFFLARRLGDGVAANFPWDKYADFLKERIQGLAASGQGAVAENARVDLGKLKPNQDLPQKTLQGTSAEDLWKMLTGGRCWYNAPPNLLDSINTPSGRYEFAPRSLAAKGHSAGAERLGLPHFDPLPMAGEETAYPLLLVSYELFFLSDQYLANPPFLTKTLPDDLLRGTDLFVEIHPETAQRLGFGDGDRALLKTPRGEAPVRLHCYTGARQDALFMVQGLGHTAYDEYIRFKGQNVNQLLDVAVDPITGLGTVWATRAQLYKA